MATSTRALVVAFLAVVAAFVGSTFWVQFQAEGIDADTLLISRDAAPGVQVISDLRTELRELEARVIRGVAGHADSIAEIAESRKRVDELLGRALELPTSQEEAALFARLHSSIRAFDEAAERALEQARGGKPAKAQVTVDAEVRPAADMAGAAARELVEYNARDAEQAARRIEAARLKGRRIAWELDLVCAVLAIGAAFLALRVVRQAHQVQAEHHRLAERKAEELEQFASRVAHDVLSPLSAVSMALSVVERAPEHAEEALGRAKASLARVRGIVDGLLEFARAGARAEPGARSTVVPVTAGLLDELKPFAAQQSADLSVDEVADCTVACSPGVLLSVLGNLLRNAIKYLGDSPVRKVSLRVRRRRGRVLFEVEDTGPGIPASLGSRIFEPYVRGPNTGAPGIGLGLATVKRLVESHGGTLGVHAGSRGGGAVFWFELDEAAAPAPHEREAAEHHALTAGA
ncbi:MAG TPA: ATP-binding protein [Myxococcales bacterium]|nr:ATP-binding protein [Myxococcales bacterium]